MKKHDNRYDNVGKYIHVITTDLVPFDKETSKKWWLERIKITTNNTFLPYATCDLVIKIKKVPQHNDFYAMIDGKKHIFDKKKTIWSIQSNWKRKNTR